MAEATGLESWDALCRAPQRASGAAALSGGLAEGVVHRIAAGSLRRLPGRRRRPSADPRVGHRCSGARLRVARCGLACARFVLARAGMVRTLVALADPSQSCRFRANLSRIWPVSAKCGRHRANLGRIGADFRRLGSKFSDSGPALLDILPKLADSGRCCPMLIEGLSGAESCRIRSKMCQHRPNLVNAALNWRIWSEVDPNSGTFAPRPAQVERPRPRCGQLRPGFGQKSVILTGFGPPWAASDCIARPAHVWGGPRPSGSIHTPWRLQRVRLLPHGANTCPTNVCSRGSHESLPAL